MRLLCVGVLFSGSLCLLPGQTAFVTGSGYTSPPLIAVAPGQVTTFYVGGLPQTAAGVQKVNAVLNVGGTAQNVSIVSARATDAVTLGITVMIPFTVTPGLTASIQFGESDGDPCSENLCTAPIDLTIIPVASHIITTCDTLYGPATSPCQLAVTHQNGSLVTNAAPAKVGEILSIWAVGFGVPASGIPAGGSGPIAMNDITLNADFLPGSLGVIGIPGSQTAYLFAGLASADTGLYQVNFVVPQPSGPLQSCSQSSEWFTGEGNMIISLFRLVPTVVTGISFEVFPLSIGAGGVNSICVSQ